jgi:hypothetical protein
MEHGSPSGDPHLGSIGNSREPGRAVWGDGDARSTDEAGQCRRREGALVGDLRKK